MEGQNILELLFSGSDVEPVSEPVKPTILLHFYRCNACLFQAANAEDFRTPGRYSDVTNLTCGVCPSIMIHMGQATHDKKRIEKHGLASACNATCTSAHGPMCNCPCGAANHGQGTVKEVTKTAGIPKVSADRSANYFQEHWTNFLNFAYLEQAWKDAYAERRNRPAGPYFYSYRERENQEKAQKLKDAKNRTERMIANIRSVKNSIDWTPEFPDSKLTNNAPDWRPTETIPEDYYAF